MAKIYPSAKNILARTVMLNRVPFFNREHIMGEQRRCLAQTQCHSLGENQTPHQ
jgi:hypothetical protein